MSNYYNQILFLTGTALTILAAQSSQAANNQIAKVEVNSLEHGIELRLHTDGKQTKNLSFFTVNQKNKLEANLLNTDLNLLQGKSFSKKNPFPGVSSLEIKQIDGEHTQISIATKPNFPVEQLLQQQGQEIILSLLAEAQGKKAESKSNSLTQLVTEKFNYAREFITAQIPTNVEEKTYTPPPNTSNSNPNVLVPNPEIIIGEGEKNNQQNETTSPSEPAYLPRAVAPPVGDMAVSNINTNPDLIDLGSSALVPRLVLRDAPVREVLSLLARSAGLNVVFAQGTQAQAAGEGETKEQTVSLDLENQPVQEVFNSVLLISGLNANRQGNIIYVGEKLPAQARNLVSRTIRLNQVRAENAALFLASQGAEGQRLTTEIEEVIDQDTGRVVQRKEKPAQLQSLQGAAGGREAEVDNTSPQLLKGLQVATDDRLNSITIVGEPRKVETATAFLTQLDARRRQVAVNVKVIDVNLLNEDLFNSSFSFGINDTFFVQDQGSAIMNFGDTKPPNTAQVTNSQFFPSVIPLQVPGAELDSFLDIQNAPFSNITTGLNDFVNSVSPYARPNFGTRNNPFQPGVSDITPNIEDGTVEYEYSLPSLFQFPKKFLASLEAQITSGNAKVLTDPTLMVQEGQQATVKLAQNVVESVETEIDAESGTRTITPVIAEAGLVLTVNVERIDDNGFVGLSVSPSVTSVGQTQEFDSGGGATNVLNLLSKREVSSGLIRLRDGQTLILSGIIQDQERTTVSKVPILGDIPLLGSLFRSTNKTNERAEVIVLLTPQVVDEQAGFGYNYRPGQEAREMLQQRGFTLPNSP
ncbi:type II and III secretion system protein [Stanieria cyanosphaera PCC 7437]|uniref:Type II and III secretion system protein n=1 Tax=Stanieria cyanosphaera (strain ATCC 29371 / PCC 7437) TaxID=111780 RepID=K9XX45_STAC7|nr:secretin N-terminal domain-containing protein [Stanieria cyanosphaera]AFZ37175.1 type II and III secretion system protein [Stanieria cyanosphaera PCC 7437]